MLVINPITLRGQTVQLEPLTDAHCTPLYEAAQDAKIWTYTGTKAFGEQFHAWFQQAKLFLQTKEHLPFVVRRLTDQQIIGSTRYYDICYEHHRLTIGYTWYIPAVWGSFVNPECKAKTRFRNVASKPRRIHNRLTQHSLSRRTKKNRRDRRRRAKTSHGVSRWHDSRFGGV